MRRKVLVTIPTAPSNMFIHKECVLALLRIYSDSRHVVRVVLPSHNPFENNLHHCINTFLEGDYDFWLSFDNDNPPRNNPLDLIDYDRDIIGCPTPVWHYVGKEGERPLYYNGYDYVEETGGYIEHNPKEGLQKVDAIGTGCFIVARRVFMHPDMQKGAFTRILNPDGTVEKGNDISFCERARKAGFEIFAHYDYMCNHFNVRELNSVAGAFESLYRGGK